MLTRTPAPVQAPPEDQTGLGSVCLRDVAKTFAARTVNKEKARAGESRTSSRSSTDDISSGRRGGLRSGTRRAKGPTRDQLYNEAKDRGIEGRSKMNKAQLKRAVAAKKT